MVFPVFIQEAIGGSSLLGKAIDQHSLAFGDVLGVRGEIHSTLRDRALAVNKVEGIPEGIELGDGGRDFHGGSEFAGLHSLGQQLSHGVTVKQEIIGIVIPYGEGTGVVVDIFAPRPEILIASLREDIDSLGENRSGQWAL